MVRFDEVGKMLEAKFGEHADLRPVSERLLEYANRGAVAPESMMLEEIEQVSYALLVFLSDIEPTAS